MNLAQISEFLEHLGWSYKALTDSVLKADYKGVFGISKVFFYVHDGGLRIAINPVLEKPLEAGSWGASVHKLVTALNHESPSVRMGLDRAGDLFVKVELPKQDLSFEQFTYALLNLCQVSEQLTVPVLQAQAYDKLVPLAL
ncbi:MAG: YbjN domain-containing protein [Myxococcaceae bacterium]